MRRRFKAWFAAAHGSAELKVVLSVTRKLFCQLGALAQHLTAVLRSGPEVLGLYLERPLHNRSRVHDLGRALQIQRLEGSRPGGLWDLHLDGLVLILCKYAITGRALGFQ